MKRLLTTSLILAFALMTLTGCGGSNNGPEKIAKKAMDCMVKQDMAGYMDTYNLSEVEKASYLELVNKAVKPELNAKNGIKSYEVTGSELNEAGDAATVKVHIKFGDGSEKDMTMDMVKVDGNWLQSMDTDK